MKELPSKEANTSNIATEKSDRNLQKIKTEIKFEERRKF